VKWTKNTVTVHARELRALAAVAFRSCNRREYAAIWFDLCERSAWATDGHVLVVCGRYARTSRHVFAVPMAQVPQLLRVAKASPSKSVLLGPGVRSGLSLDPMGSNVLPLWRRTAALCRDRAGSASSETRWWMGGNPLRQIGQVERGLPGNRLWPRGMVLAPSSPLDAMVVVYPTSENDNDAAREANAKLGSAGMWTVIAMPMRHATHPYDGGKS